MLEFEAWPKIPRLGNETVQVTEKIDGTNAAVIILPYHVDHEPLIQDGYAKVLATIVDDATAEAYTFATQSRKRFIKPGKNTDNAGFAGWAWDNSDKLVTTLGYGKHFGEWYGSGIQHGYGLKEKRFALFNASRWADLSDLDVEERPIPNLEVVPVLYDGPAVEDLDGPSGEFRYTGMNPVKQCIEFLRREGSRAVKGYMSPEGVIAYYRLARVSYKGFLHNNATAKGAQ